MSCTNTITHDMTVHARHHPQEGWRPSTWRSSTGSSQSPSGHPVRHDVNGTSPPPRLSRDRWFMMYSRRGVNSFHSSSPMRNSLNTTHRVNIRSRPHTSTDPFVHRFDLVHGFFDMTSSLVLSWLKLTLFRVGVPVPQSPTLELQHRNLKLYKFLTFKTRFQLIIWKQFCELVK